MNPQRNIIQDTIADIACLFYEWVAFTKKPLQAWRKTDKKMGDTMMPKGEEIQISNTDYDLDRLFIECTITPEQPTDQVQKINNARMMLELGMSKRDILESLSVPHPELQLDASALEKMKDGYVQAFITELMAKANAKVQIETQQAMAGIQQQQQAAQQAAQQEQQPPAPSPFDNTGGPGFNPAEGGQPPIEGAPGMGREQMNGQTANGQDVQQ